MNDKDIELTIEINYENEKFSIKTKEQIKLEELLKRSIQKFNIDEERIKNIYFTYTDEKCNTNKIKSLEDIYIAAKKEINSDNYISIINLTIDKTEEEILNKELNNNVISQNINNYLEEKEELQKNIETIKNQYEIKVKELEELIKKMKKEHFIELNKIKKEKKLENSKFTNETERNNQNIEILGKNLIQNGMEKIENMIINIINKEKDNLIETIKTMKKEIISEIKEEFKEDKIKYDIFNNIKTDLNNINLDIKEKLNGINIDIKENINKTQNIQNDLTNVKKSISKIEEKKEGKEKEAIKENLKQGKNKDNNDLNYINNQNYYNPFNTGYNYITNQNMNNPFNIGNNYLNIPSYMNNITMNKFYMCMNCKNFYTLNECFDPINNKHYN